VWGLLGSAEGIHSDIRKMARKMDIEPPTLEAIKRNAYVPDAEEAGKTGDKAIMDLVKNVRSIGGDSGKKDKGKAMTEADQACYASRYTDLKDKPAKEHFKLIGSEQGRLSTCARSLTDFEALRYLHTFPEL